jgi:glycosyltransferase involved in cell wall biosynthesis
MTLMLREGISVVIPVYNSEGTLRDVVARLDPVLRANAKTYELILVNDGSRDASWSVVEELTAGHDWVRGIDLARNYGQHNALACGIRAAKHEIVVTMDDDLQNPPEEIPRLMEKLDAGFDVVYGTPEQEQHGLWRDLASQITKWALRQALGVESARDVSAFRAFRGRLREVVSIARGPYVSIDVLLSWGTSRFGAVKVRHEPRTVGVSNYTFTKLLLHAVNMTTGFSTWPLRAASMIGFFFTCLGILLLLYVLFGLVAFGRQVPGFAFLASALAIFSGAQLFALGIIGEYLARVYLRAVERPAFVVRTTTD